MMSDPRKLGLETVKLILASIRKRGWIRTLILLRDESYFDLAFDTDTRTPVPVADLTVKAADKLCAQPYQATNWAILKQVFHALLASGQIDPKTTYLVDFGCGKGRVLVGALHFGIARVVGVEFDGVLCDICRKNLSRYAGRRRVGTPSTWDVIHANAADFQIPAGANLFYLYNPFSGAVLEAVARNIREACRKAPTQCLVVYVNPTGCQVFENLGFTKSGHSDREAAIYTWDAASDRDTHPFVAPS